MARWEGLIRKYRHFLPVSDNTEIITLCEGNTPLIRAENLERRIGADFEIYLKYEGLNPTGSLAIHAPINYRQQKDIRCSK